ncbi:hypothetical protein SOVF_047220 [Spinacia oleracea]|nr:hypothetical protein SOVF_047220 [Spinacia oleracea]
MTPGGSRSKSIGFGRQGHGDGGGGGGGGAGAGGGRGRRSDGWVWPPRPRIKNSVLHFNNQGTCSCASQIPRQQQQQQQQQQTISLTMPSSISYSVYHNVSAPPVSIQQGNNPRPLRFLFCKELTYSDVKKRNKIILPRVIVASKERNEVLNGECSVPNNGDLGMGLMTSSYSPSACNYVYLNQLSDFCVVDEMEEVATPRTPYPYGNATWTATIVSFDLPPLQTFNLFDFPIDNMSWT